MVSVAFPHCHRHTRANHLCFAQKSAPIELCGATLPTRPEGGISFSTFSSHRRASRPCRLTMPPPPSQQINTKSRKQNRGCVCCALLVSARKKVRHTTTTTHHPPCAQRTRNPTPQPWGGETLMRRPQVKRGGGQCQCPSSGGLRDLTRPYRKFLPICYTHRRSLRFILHQSQPATAFCFFLQDTSSRDRKGSCLLQARWS